VTRTRQAMLALAAVAAGATLGAAAWLARGDVPDFAAVRASFRPSDVELLDRRGDVLHELRADDRQRSLAWVPLDAVSPLLLRAIVASEDRRFASHPGVDPLAAASALRGWLAGAPARGASTITMQLASLLDRRAGRPATGAMRAKVRQAGRALAIERAWTKDQILEAYLNLVPFRGEVSGVGAGAGVLFGKRPHGLAQDEALVLAVLPRSPNASSERVAERAARLAARLDVSTAPEQIARVAAQARAGEAAAPPRIALAPHLARRLLASRVGGEDRATPLATTLDARLQDEAARLLEEQLRELAGRNVKDGALLVVDNASGDVLAYVGGRGARATARHVDAVRARRQAGSTLKPFLYAMAIEQRLLTAASLLEDTPLALPVAGGLYQPRNYDESFRGLVSLRSALASSLNVPAVRTLGLISGDAFVARLRVLGFGGLRHGAEFYGPALALGSAEVSLEELVGAYRTLANGGVATPLRFVASDAPAGQGARALAPDASFVIGDVLADRASRSATFGLENVLATRAWSAVKTGTSKEMRDNWCVGFSRRYTVGVWVGNAGGEPMHDVSGLSGAAPVWRALMDLLHADLASLPPAPPDGLLRARATFAGDLEPRRDEWFLRGTEPGAAPPRLTAPVPRIANPLPGTVLAIDPDVPRDLQRLALEARGATGASGVAARWRLDGRDLGPASETQLWPIVGGRHALALVAPDGRVLDEVAFEVRGDAARSGTIPPGDATDASSNARSDA
jgi:penicillin-binding protein 1C